MAEASLALTHYLNPGIHRPIDLLLECLLDSISPISFLYIAEAIYVNDSRTYGSRSVISGNSGRNSSVQEEAITDWTRDSLAGYLGRVMYVQLDRVLCAPFLPSGITSATAKGNYSANKNTESISYWSFLFRYLFTGGRNGGVEAILTQASL